MAAGASFPSPEALISKYPLDTHHVQQVAAQRSSLQDILQGTGWILIVGPCGLHHIGGALEYADRLAALKAQLPTDWTILMRCCFEKSRSSLGWKGFLHGGEARTTLHAGLEQTRFVLREVLMRGIGTASELLSPFALPYLEDLLTYGWIGARTSSSQTHRELASAVPFAVGFKNSLDGDLQAAMKGAWVCAQPHSQMAIGPEGHVQQIVTQGTPCLHVILRGSMQGPNVSTMTIRQVAAFMDRHRLCRRVMVDCSHGNTGKRPELQGQILKQALSLHNSVAGVLIESYLEGGMRPDLGAHSDPFFSITDPCLSWEETRSLLLDAADSYAGASIQWNHSWCGSANTT